MREEEVTVRVVSGTQPLFYHFFSPSPSSPCWAHLGRSGVIRGRPQIMKCVCMCILLFLFIPHLPQHKPALLSPSSSFLYFGLHPLSYGARCQGDSKGNCSVFHGDQADVEVFGECIVCKSYVSSHHHAAPRKHHASITQAPRKHHASTTQAPRSTPQHPAALRSITQHHAAPRSTAQHHAVSRNIPAHHHLITPHSLMTFSSSSFFFDIIRKTADKLPVRRLMLGTQHLLRDNFVECKMECGHHAVGITKIWVHLFVNGMLF